MNVHEKMYTHLPIYAFDRLFYQRYFAGNYNRILDVGCSFGHQMRVDPSRKWGIDIDPQAIAYVKNMGFPASVCDVGREAFPFRDRYFGSVECRHLLEHLDISGRENCIREIHRVLLDGGNVVFDIPNIEKMGWQYWNHYQHRDPMTMKAFRELVEDCGFHVVWFGHPHSGFWGAKHIPLKYGLIVQDLLYAIGIKKRQILRIVARKES